MSGALRHKKGWRVQRQSFVLRDMRTLIWYKDNNRSKPDGFLCLDGYLWVFATLAACQAHNQVVLRRAAPECPPDFQSALEEEEKGSAASTSEVAIVLVHGMAADRHPQFCVQAPSAAEAQRWIESFNTSSARRRRRSSAGATLKAAAAARASTPQSGRASPGLPQFRDPPAALLSLRRPAAGAAQRGTQRKQEHDTKDDDKDALRASHAAELAGMAGHLSDALDSAEQQWQRAEALQAALELAASSARSLQTSLDGIVQALGVNPLPVDSQGSANVDSGHSGDSDSSGIPPDCEATLAIQRAGATASSILEQLAQSPLAPLSALQSMATDAASDAALAALATACDRNAMMRRFPLSASLAASPMLGLLSRDRRELVAPDTLRLLARVARQQNVAQQAHIPLSPLLLHEYKSSAHLAQVAAGGPSEPSSADEGGRFEVVHRGSADCVADWPRLTVTLATPAQSTAARIELKRARTDASFEAAAAGDGSTQDGTAQVGAAAIARKLGEAAADAFLERVAAATAAIDELPFHNGMQALRSFFALYAPEKIGSEAESLADFAGREEALFAMLERKYLRPVRVPYIPLSSMPTAPGLVLQPHWRPQHWQQWKSHVIVQETADRMLQEVSAPMQGSLDMDSVQRQLNSSTRGCGGGAAAMQSALASPRPDGRHSARTALQLRMQEDERNVAFETNFARNPVEAVCQGGRGQWLLKPALLRQPPDPAPAQGLPPDWVDEASVKSCQICAAAWSVSCRCHHCRACGRAVCAACAPAVRALVPPGARAHIPSSSHAAQTHPSTHVASDRSMVWNSADRLDAVTTVPDGAGVSARRLGTTGGRPIPEFGYMKAVRVCLDCMKM